MIKVKAGAGRALMLPLDVKAGPNRRHIRIDDSTEIEVDENHHFVKRRLKLGDLVAVAQSSTPAPKKAADAPAPKRRSKTKNPEG